MEAEDPISAKFQTLVEALMVKTTSEIVKVFVDVLLETRVEISRSWKEIDALKQQLEQREEPRAESVFRSQMTQVDLKCETSNVNDIPEVQEDVSHTNPQITVLDTSTVEPQSTDSQDEVQIQLDASVESTESREECVPDNVPDNVPTTPEITTPDTPDICSFVTSSNQNQKAQVTQIGVKRKKGHPVKSDAVTKLQTPTNITREETQSLVEPLPVVSPQQSSASTGIIILGKKFKKKGAVVTRKQYMQKNVSPVHGNTPHSLRGRQFLSQRPCLCCSSNQCAAQQNPPKNSSPVVPRVYTCSDCGANFKERAQFKVHKCSLTCNRCGQTFINLRNLTSHSRGALTSSKKAFPYHCYLCGHKFATQCGWNMHKKIHAHGRLSENIQQETPSISCLIPVPKELKANLEVRLERISDAQLEAALSPKSSLLLVNKTSLSSPTTPQTRLSSAEAAVTTVHSTSPSQCVILSAPVLNEESGSKSGAITVMECPGSSSETGSGETGSGKTVRQSDSSAEDSVNQLPSTRPMEKRMPVKSLTLCNRVATVEHEEALSSPSEELAKGLNSRKRKISDCSHDVYNGVFPVEKILKWRNIKGRNEVRIKWMPCSLCGAKWKNTWEPAESFISYKDENESSEQRDKQK